MADLLPSIPDAPPQEDAEPRVVGLEDEDADDVLGALSSTTARALLAALNEDPAHPSALAERADTSLQNVQYHLGKLEDADVVEVVDTAYSEKGREMDVYAPADRPLVLFAGNEEEQTLLHRALGRLLGGVGALAGASVAVRGFVDANASTGAAGSSETGAQYTGDTWPGTSEDDAATTADEADGADATAGDDAAAFRDSGNDASFDVAESGERSVEPLSQEFSWIAEALDATGLPPELAVFLVGSCLLAVTIGTWCRLKRQTRV